MTDYNITKEYNQGVQSAMEEAERFLEKARAYLKYPGYRHSSSTRAAMKRASIDLSKSLVAIRGQIL